jgi:hypothetical protein
VTARVYPDKEGEPVHFYPGPAGAKEWTHAAYSPRTGLFYVPVQDTGATATRRRREFKESIPYWGAGVQVDIEDMAKSISAFDANGVATTWPFRIPRVSVMREGWAGQHRGGNSAVGGKVRTREPR